MARSEARLSVDIWTDPDFIARTSGAQQRFMFLLSQPDLAHDGVIPLRPGRWARKSADSTIDSVRGELAELAAARFIVVDDDTEELLIRSFIRQDKVFKQPNVMRAAVDHVPLIESSVILDALATECDRIRSENPDLTEQQAATLAEMANALAKRLKGASAPPAGEASEKGSAKATPGTPGVRGVVTEVSTDFPVPRSPDPESPVPGTTPLATLASSSPPREKSRSKPKRRLPDDFAPTEAMKAWAREHTPLVGNRDHAAFCDYWRGNGTTKADWEATWRNWMRKAQTDAERHSARASPPPGAPRPSTTDQRVGAALALAAEFRNEARKELPQ